MLLSRTSSPNTRPPRPCSRVSWTHQRPYSGKAGIGSFGPLPAALGSTIWISPRIQGRSCLPAVVNRRALLGERAHGLAEVLRRHQARQLWPQGREGGRLTLLFVTVHGGDGCTYPERRRRGDLAREL